MTLYLPNSAPAQLIPSRQLVPGDIINNITAQLNSNEVGITAKAGGGQASATQLRAATNIIATVATANDSAKLPKGINGLEVWVQNAGGGNSAQIFTYGTGTINNTDGVATGVALAASLTGATIYKCLYVNAQTGAETWVSK